MTKLSLIGLLGAALLLGGCANDVGVNPVTATSDFDGAKTVTIMPHGAECCIAVGAFWTDKAPDVAVLEFKIFGAYTNIESVELNIDGKFIRLDAAQRFTNFSNNGGMVVAPGVPIVRESTMGFSTSLDVVKSITASQKTVVRLTTLNDGAVVAKIKDGATDSKAYYALQRFLAAIPRK